jgi:anti-sigma factor RsiW
MNQMSTDTDQVVEWLGAYLDGELSAERRAWVEGHLPGCPTCRAELEALRSLRNLLQSAPEPAPRQSATAYAQALIDRLSQHPRANASPPLPPAIRYAPLGIFAAWAFFQAVVWVAKVAQIGLLFLPGGTALLGAPAEPTLPAASGAAAWLTGVLRLTSLTTLMDEIAWALRALPSPAPVILLELALAALMVFLMLAWLAGVWALRRSAAHGLAE